MKRRTFSEDAPTVDRASGTDIVDGSRPLWRCAAHGCQMPGATAEHSHARDWWCAYHFGEPSGRLQAITAALHEQSRVCGVILRSRRMHIDLTITTDDLAAALPKAVAIVERSGLTIPPHRRGPQFETLRSYVYRVEEALSGWVRSRASEILKADRARAFSAPQHDEAEA